MFRHIVCIFMHILLGLPQVLDSVQNLAFYMYLGIYYMCLGIWYAHLCIFCWDCQRFWTVSKTLLFIPIQSVLRTRAVDPLRALWFLGAIGALLSCKSARSAHPPPPPPPHPTPPPTPPTPDHQMVRGCTPVEAYVMHIK